MLIYILLSVTNYNGFKVTRIESVFDSYEKAKFKADCMSENIDNMELEIMEDLLR